MILERALHYASHLAPLLIMCALALTIRILFNLKARKAGKQRGIIE